MGVSLSECVRRKLEEAPPVTREEYKHLEIDVVYQIKKIGVNINQIAKKYNSYMLTEASEELLEELSEVKCLLNELVYVDHPEKGG